MSYFPSLDPTTDDTVVSALVGNGAICTTLSPSGFHEATRSVDVVAHRTQSFVWAGRRMHGPRHRLTNFGSLSRVIKVNGQEQKCESWTQTIVPETGCVRSTLTHSGVSEVTVSRVCLHRNVFLAETEITNGSAETLELEWTVCLDISWARPAEWQEERECLVLDYELEDHLGQLRFMSDGDGIQGAPVRSSSAVCLTHEGLLAPGSNYRIRIAVQFSDRETYDFPVSVGDVDDLRTESDHAWGDFWSRSTLSTGCEIVDQFRTMSLYTMRCQATDWSIPPTLSETYWGGGAFHDEMYPFLGLLSGDYVDLAVRIPRFRLMTLGRALVRGKGIGALYPWSSTETGEERDPHGNWLTERFHLGQFSVCIKALWEYTADLATLRELYPVVREIGRYFENAVLERDASGTLGCRPCVDFDESVGPVRNGPFTVSAAIFSLRWAADAAEILGLKTEQLDEWRRLADELAGVQKAETIRNQGYTIPDGRANHMSVLGVTFPFGVDVASEHALAAAARVHEACRTPRGWRPGDSEVFRGSAWMWTAGHLAAVHCIQNRPDLAWDAIVRGPESAGPFVSPNEHVDRNGVVQVPWFTTGCGGWLYALHSLVVRVSDDATHLLSGVPETLPNLTFEKLKGGRGATLSGRVLDGKLVSLSVESDITEPWTFRIPMRFVAPEGRAWLEATAHLASGTPIDLLGFINTLLES